MKTKTITGLALAVALGGGLGRAAARCGKDLMHDPNPHCVARGWARRIEGNPRVLSSPQFKALPPGIRREAEALDYRYVTAEIAALKARFQAIMAKHARAAARMKAQNKAHNEVKHESR